MSADNYYFVRKRNSDGKYDVTHRYASSSFDDYIKPFSGDHEYNDELAYPPASPDFTFDTLEQAILFAHKWMERKPTEYGVRVQIGLL
jgi:hypothetical protein